MRSSLQFRHKLIYKILLLFLIPIICQFGIGCLLWQSTNNSEELGREQRRQDADEDQTARQFALFALAAMNLAKFEASHKSLFLASAADQLTRLRATVNTSEDRELATHLDNVKGMLVEQAMAAGGIEHISNMTEEQSAPFFKEIDKAAHYWIEKRSTERQQLANTKRSEEMYRQRIRFLVQVLFPLSTTIAFLVPFIFLRSAVSRRLELVVENAHRLPMGVPLEPQLKGDDEISDLDAVLHQSEVYLKDATEQRGLIMEMVAHDMRSPLMSAQIANDLAMRLTETRSFAQEKNFLAVKRNLSVVINLLDELLTIDRLESGALELSKAKLELRPLVEETIENVYALSDARRIKLKNDCQADLRANIDKDRILQVLTNLISNSIKFSPAGSTITITSQESDRFVQICVADQGPGLPPGSEKTVFEKFHQTDQRHAKRGFGLGLTICKMLIELHNGTIAASNGPDGGARFCFSVPKVKQFEV